MKEPLKPGDKVMFLGLRDYLCEKHWFKEDHFIPMRVYTIRKVSVGCLHIKLEGKKWWYEPRLFQKVEENL